MFKVTPNPPTPHDRTFDPQKIQEATDSALDY